MRPRRLCKYSFALVAVALSVLLGTSIAIAQTTSFTYQGRLTDGGTSAHGNYDLQFALWDSLSGGGQVGSTQTLNTVAVSNGVFTVTLDFGANAFPGASRFLEISARPSGGGSFTLLSPRQPITPTPYAIRSLNASSADSVPASGVPAGSGNYIQNSNSQQASSNFSISGNGTAGGTLAGNVVNATTQYNLNGSRILGNPGTANLFAGIGAGAANTTGINNNFFGVRTGETNTTGSQNSFFGNLAGEANTMGTGNSFFGRRSGSSNTTGSSNTLIGLAADVSVGNLTNATAIGANAEVDASNALVLGSINGVNGATADTNVGIGTTKPAATFHAHRGTTSAAQGPASSGTTQNNPLARFSNVRNTTIDIGFQQSSPFAMWLQTTDVTNLSLTYPLLLNPNGGNVGIGTTTPPDQSLSVFGNASKTAGGTSWAVFSDERLKNIKGQFTPGLKALLQLQPIRFEYRPDNALGLPSGGAEEVGFSAQEVEKVLPDAVSRTQQGYLQLHSDPILWTMLNAIKEQQTQIQQQREWIERQQALSLRQRRELNALKKLVCRSHRRARVCR